MTFDSVGRIVNILKSGDNRIVEKLYFSDKKFTHLCIRDLFLKIDFLRNVFLKKDLFKNFIQNLCKSYLKTKYTEAIVNF